MLFSSYFLPRISFAAVSMTFPLSLSSSFSSSLTRVLSFTTKPTHYRAILENENRPEQSSGQREKERDWRKRVLFFVRGGFECAVKYTGESIVGFGLCDL
jgi:hypothetical protein